MASLQYKTRGGASPQGKPRVYFCCHPKDFERYFKTISDEILAKQNCAVWYNPEPEAEYGEAFFADLREMQLFVMPVTHELLGTANRALDVEFRFAVDNHIPVLPLMQDSGLEELFNEKCGDLQFLDKNNRDATAISYDEKLERYLSSVLIGDELAEKIRAAFDAYVFLSYRKKDRQHAQELMRLIHKNDFCRDIAIWYDEYLVPGEDFNDAIKSALEKSGLFVLAVTPNLINESNYVMTEEYPRARNSGKPILPAELVPTDRNLLAEKYEDIPDCTDAHDETALSGALLDAIRKIAIKENDNSPEHSFFIGLAYLGGVDVEVDHERAAALITSAADSGLAEAAGQLVRMYRTGMGVARSHETAVGWQERKIELLEAALGEKPDFRKQNELFWEIIDCGDYYGELGRSADARKKYDRGVSLARDSDDYSSNMHIRRNLSAAHQRLGNVLLAADRPAEAREHYEAAYEIAAALAEKRSSAGFRQDLATQCEKLGDAYRAEGNLKKAREYFEKSFELRFAVVGENSTPETRSALAVSYDRLGDICVEEGDFAAAREHYEKGFAIRNAIADELGTIDARRNLSVSHIMLGNLCLAEGNPSEAREYFGKALEISIDIDNDSGTIASRRDLSADYIALGDVCAAGGDAAAARECYEKAVDIRSAIADETGTTDAMRNLAVGYERLGKTYYNEQDYEKAWEYHEKSFDIRAAIADETGTIRARRELAVSYHQLGSISADVGDWESAKECYEQVLEISLEIADETGTIDARQNVSMSCVSLGIVVLRLEDDREKAREYFEKSIEISTAIVEETDMPEARDDLALAYGEMGMALEDKDCIKKAIALSEEVCRECPDVARYTDFLEYLRQTLQQMGG